MIKERSLIARLLLVMLVGLIATATVNVATASHTECHDQQDNDGDLAVDGFDRDCESEDDFHEVGSHEPECSNGVDDDHDGFIDFGTEASNDSDCESDDDPTEGGQPPAECNDGLDNDHDGLIDFADDGDDDGEPGQDDDGDPDCDSTDDPTETPEGPECNDGIDNDGDGLIDFADDGDDDGEPGDADDGDPDCDDVDDSETPECNDGIDNDGDGLIDFADDGDDDGEPGQDDDGDPNCDDVDDDDEGTTCSTDNGGDGTIHSNFAPDQNEDGPISGFVHDADQALVIPLVTADGGVVPEVNCAVVKGILGL